ncbi:MAG: 5-formyltetrahydrofolate cyclo-ligase [Sphaerochaetaceae bacterium]|nr:5-formyltetrahydrofolate cyclo-ligase [Sphaerochaetaceae bacterium]
MDKNELRRKNLVLLKNSPRISPEIVKNTLTLMSSWKEAKAIFGYIPLPSEIDVTLAMDYGLDNGKAVYFPSEIPGKYNRANNSWKNNTKILPSKVKVLDSVFETDIGQIKEKALVLVPGLAFTKDGKRLGRGGGYYDRVLSQIENMDNFTILGICNKNQLMKDLPQEVHDKKVHTVVTF